MGGLLRESIAGEKKISCATQQVTRDASEIGMNGLALNRRRYQVSLCLLPPENARKRKAKGGEKTPEKSKILPEKRLGVDLENKKTLS